MITAKGRRIEDIVALSDPDSLVRRPFENGTIRLSDHVLPTFYPDDTYQGLAINIPQDKDAFDFYNPIAEICRAAKPTGKHEKLFGGLYEAFRNAHQHGNKKDPEKAIRINYRATEDAFEVVVSDEGGKLDANFIPFILLHRQGLDKPYPFYRFAPHVERREENSGTGTYVMHMAADEVNYYKNQWGGLSAQLIVRKSESKPQEVKPPVEQPAHPADNTEDDGIPF